jgi:hypothetical protein
LVQAILIGLGDGAAGGGEEMKSKSDVRDRAEALLLCEDMLVQSYKDWIDREAECMGIAREWRIPPDELQELWEEWKDKKEIEEWNTRRIEKVVERKPAVKEVVREATQLGKPAVRVEKPKVEVKPATKEVVGSREEVRLGVKPAVRDIEAEIKAKREAEAKAEAEKAKREAEVKVEEPKVTRVEPKADGGWRFVQKADGSKWMVKGNDWRRHIGPLPTGKPSGGVVELRVVEQRKPEPEAEPKIEEPNS